MNNDLFRFDPTPCRSANVSLKKATLFFDEHSNVDLIQNFGLGLAHKLLNQGTVEKPLGDSEDTQTNIWKLTDAGLKVLKPITGVEA